VDSRRRSRILALQTLYESDTVKHPIGQVLDRLLREESLDEETVDVGRRLVSGVAEKASDIDTILQAAAPAWPLSQMPGVDKALLRLAIFEAIFDNSAAPVKVIINEAVDLARSYGSESSPKFVNGVLGSVVAHEETRQEHRDT
jgi:transcription antitermination protein NusB